ncbi:recombination regulator RecX, partial [Lactobacillus sp. XV13L]|nr:recombination regulator RecX [Lactobacillus sp. XV13L]
FEVLQYLNQHDVDEQSAQSAVAQLSEMGFLDDRKYVEVAVRQSLRTGTEGPLSLSRKMTQKGVAAELVESELAAIADEDWLDAGLRVLKSMKSKVGKLSERELERKMRSKLMSHGFSGALVEMIIAEVNLQTGTDEQLEALKKQGVKAYKRFRRLSASARQTKMRNYLYAHGFTSSEIDSFMAGEIIPLDELAEY